MDKSLYSQQPAIDLLRSMGYTYISPEDCEAQRGSRYHVLLKDILRGQLRRLNRYAFAGAENEFSAANIERAMEDLDEPLKDKHVIVIEDIVDSGRTLSYLMAMLKDRHPASLRLCTLLDKPDRRVVDVHVDYTGFQIPDEFVVGYGLDYDQKYRNLPYIGLVELD